MKLTAIIVVLRIIALTVGAMVAVQAAVGQRSKSNRSVASQAAAPALRTFKRRDRQRGITILRIDKLRGGGVGAAAAAAVKSRNGAAATRTPIGLTKTEARAVAVVADPARHDVYSDTHIAPGATEANAEIFNIVHYR